jgi:hypothetical protein
MFERSCSWALSKELPGDLDLTGLEILANQHAFTDLMSGPLKSNLHKYYFK